MEKKMNDICDLENKLICFAQQHCEDPDIPTYGAVIDMIKDLSEVEKNSWKACYYRCMVESMMGDEGGTRRAGYDHWHYANGRFAPTGRGHRVGYIPMDMMHMDPMLNDWRIEGSDPAMGEHKTSGKNKRYGYPMNMKDMYPESAYDRWNESRRHYHESKNPEDKQAMERQAKEAVEEVEDSVRDIWDGSSPELRKDMKRSLTNLLNSLSV